MNKQENYSLTEEEYNFLKEKADRDELLWKYKKALEEADEEKLEKEKNEKIIEQKQYQIEKLKEKLERKENEINQIDDILIELFGVKHDIEKPEEFRKILKHMVTKPDNSISVAYALINGKKSCYHFTDFGVSELRQISEHLLVYCNNQSENENE